MRIEKLNESASAKIKAIAATKFKGVRSRPTDNSMNACALVAAKMAHKHGCDYFVIPGGWACKSAMTSLRAIPILILVTASASPLMATCLPIRWWRHESLLRHRTPWRAHWLAIWPLHHA